MTKLLKKSDIFARKSLEPRSIYVADWGGEVRYKPMSMTERREVRKRSSEVRPDPTTGEMTVSIDTERLEIYTVVTCVLDPTDNKKLMFGPEDIPVLEEQIASGGISTVAQAILRDSGMAGNAAFRREEAPKS